MTSYITANDNAAPTVLEYVTTQLNRWGFYKDIQGDFTHEGVTYVDVEFKDAVVAANWLRVASHVVGDLRDPVASLRERVVVTVTATIRQDARPFDLGQHVAYGREFRNVGTVEGFSEDFDQVLIKNDVTGKLDWRSVRIVRAVSR